MSECSLLISFIFHVSAEFSHQCLTSFYAISSPWRSYIHLILVQQHFFNYARGSNVKENNEGIVIVSGSLNASTKCAEDSTYRLIHKCFVLHYPMSQWWGKRDILGASNLNLVTAPLIVWFCKSCLLPC